MREPLTDKLLEELLNSPDPARFVAKHRIAVRHLPEYLQQLLDEKGLSRSEVVRNAQIDDTYGYYIFMGKRRASRDYIVRIALSMKCTLIEANRMLQAAGHNELYCKNRRDAIIIFCITHESGVQRTNEELYRFGEQTLHEKTH